MDVEAYCNLVPKENQWKLDKQLDFEHEGVQTHLGEISNNMDEWEGRVAEALKLTPATINGIKEKHPDNFSLQTREALHQWKMANGLKATYRNLIAAFLTAGQTSFAEVVCKVLGYAQDHSRQGTIIGELGTISNELAPVKHKWREIGRQLGVTEEQFQQCTHPEWFSKPIELLCEVLDFWLNGNTSVSPTWENVVSALQSDSVGEVELSQYLEDKYCQFGVNTDIPQISVEESKATVAVLKDHYGEDLSLSLVNVFRALGTILSDWFPLGVFLGISVVELNVIEMKYMNGSRRMIEMINVWLNNDVQPSWSKLCKALEDMGNMVLSEVIRSKYCSIQYERKSFDLDSEITLMAVSMALTDLLDWYRLGIYLGIEMRKLDQIRVDFVLNARQRDEMIGLWIRSDKDASWEKLCAALENMDRNILAEQIRARYCTM